MGKKKKCCKKWQKKGKACGSCPMKHKLELTHKGKIKVRKPELLLAYVEAQ